MDVLKLLNIKQPILLLKTLSDGNLGILDAQNSLRILSCDTYALIGGFKTNIQHDRLIGSHLDISLNADYSISTLPGTNQAALFSIVDKTLIHKLGRHKGEVESVGIDPNSRYCVTAGQDGKTFIWVLKTARLAFTMPPHGDFVTTIAFNENGQWIATGSYDRTIHVLNLGIMKQPLKLRGHGGAVIKTVFLSDARLLSADKEGGLIVWNLRTGQLIKRLPKMNDEVSAMSVSSDGRFVCVGTKLGYVALYDMERLEPVTQRYLKESEPVTSLAFLQKPYRLAVGTAEGNVRIYALLGNEAEYMNLLRERQYKAFYSAVEANPMLRYSKAYHAAEKIWSDVVNKARTFLENNERDKAKEIAELFAGIPKKSAFIAQMFQDYDKFSQFRAHVQDERFGLAYSLANQHPAFKDSDLYRNMEDRWQKRFAKAQELIMKPNGEEQARTVLSPYRGISSKTPLIQQLFNERRMYEYFKKVITQRDYVKFFDLIKRHPFLREFAEYRAVLEYADKLYIQTHKAYVAGEYATAQKGCDILIGFPDYAHEAQTMSETIKIKHLFLNAIAANNLSNAFSYLSTFTFLYETPEAEELERQWNRSVDEAQRHAAKGEPREALEVFEPYRTVREKYAAMGVVMEQAYCAQIENKISGSSPQSVIENGIRRYVAVFGIEEGIVSVFNDFKNHYESALVLETLKSGSLESWTPLMRIDDITAA